MKRTAWTRKTPLKKTSLSLSGRTTGFQAPSGMKRKVGLNYRGTSESSVLKEKIQGLLRQIAIKRDGGCVLRHYPECGKCGPLKNDGKPVLQAEHLHSRVHSISFADMRNIVCLCAAHHIFWKNRNSKRYWEIIEELIGPARWDYLKKVEAYRLAYKLDLKLAIVGLEQELKEMKK